MYIYELTRYAILCSERDNQGQALELLMKAEVFYHDQRVNESLAPLEPNSLLGLLDSLNPESSKEMFTYVLFYLGQVRSSIITACSEGLVISTVIKLGKSFLLSNFYRHTKSKVKKNEPSSTCTWFSEGSWRRETLIILHGAQTRPEWHLF
jgi:hypothetical protein